MWSYYGTKHGIIDYYPKPIYNKIIEPFAGAAAYSLKYFDNDIHIYDIDQTIINLWKWLQQCSKEDINKLPHYIKPGETLNNYNFDCIEARELLGFLIAKGSRSPRTTPSNWVLCESNYINYKLKNIENSLYKIKHWKINLLSYEKIKNVNATWFIDPPYQFGGQHYKHSNKNIDYKQLKNYVLTRKGQIIVCENTKANWLNFLPIAKMKGVKYITTEAIYSNKKTNYHIIQENIFNAA